MTEPKPILFKFDRYIDGKAMAEGVNAGEHPNLESATKAAARLASPGPRGQVPVLVLRTSTPAPSPVVVEGWKLVPMEPTCDQQNAGFAAMKDTDEQAPHPYAVYQAMLSVSPLPTGDLGEPPLRGLKEGLAEFFRWAMRDGPWDGCDLDGAAVQAKALALGLIHKVPFDPEKHDDITGSNPEPGSDWFMFTRGIEPSSSEPQVSGSPEIPALMAAQRELGFDEGKEAAAKVVEALLPDGSKCPCTRCAGMRESVKAIRSLSTPPHPPPRIKERGNG